MRVFAFVAAALATVHIARATPDSQTEQANEAKDDNRLIDGNGEPIGFFDFTDPASEAIGAGLGAAGVEITDEKASDMLGIISSTGTLASQFLPPPYSIVAGTGFATLGALIGAEPQGVDNAKILNFLENAFAEVNVKLDNIQDDVDKILDGLEAVAATVDYINSNTAQELKETYMRPIDLIHADYQTMMEDQFPYKDGRKWKKFFKEAQTICDRHKSKRNLDFLPSRVLQIVKFYEQETVSGGGKINNMGMCGSAMLFQYIVTVHQELLMMCTYASYVRKSGKNGNNFNHWKLGDVGEHASDYKKNLEGYDDIILNAVSEGGRGLARFVHMPAAKLLEGVTNSELELGWCYRCDDSSNACAGNPYKPFDWPTSEKRVQGDPDHGPNVDNFSNQRKCNAHTFQKKWYYFDMGCLGKTSYADERNICCKDKDNDKENTPGGKCRYQCVYEKKCPNPLRGLTEIVENQRRMDKDPVTIKETGGLKRMGCCTCACLMGEDLDKVLGRGNYHNDDFGGRKIDHKQYDRHCALDEAVPDPMDGFLATREPYDKDALKGFNTLPLSTNFRISCVDNEKGGVSTLAISAQTEAFRDEFGFRHKDDPDKIVAPPKWFHASRSSYITAITFTNNATHKRNVRKKYFSDLTGYSNIWFAKGERDQKKDKDKQCDDEVGFGKYKVHIGNWRLIALTQQGRLIVNHENGRNSKVYRCNGKGYSNQSEYEGGFGSLGDTKCAFVTPRYLQIGSWRIGRWNDKDRHVSVTHRNGYTVEIYRTDGKVFGKTKSPSKGGLWDSSKRRDDDDIILAGSDEGCLQAYADEEFDCRGY